MTELEQIYKATCEDLARLRYRERILLDQSGAMSDESNESAGFGQILKGLEERRLKSSFYVGLSATSPDVDSVSVLSRNSAYPLIHVDNYF